MFREDNNVAIKNNSGDGYAVGMAEGDGYAVGMAEGNDVFSPNSIREGDGVG